MRSLVIVVGVFIFLTVYFKIIFYVLHLASIDLHDMVDDGSVLYFIIHDNRWLIGLILGYAFGVAHPLFKGRLRQGIQEFREWRGRG